MRSLVLLDAAIHPVNSNSESTSSKQTLSQAAIDPSTGAIYTILESSSLDGVTQLAVQYLEKTDFGNESQHILQWHADSLYEGSLEKAVLSAKFLPENDSLCVILANGDIEQIYNPSDAQQATRENVGSFETGLKAAAWSPDDELLALITGDDKLLVMTKDFDVLSEGPFRTTQFGEDAPVNVGWGEKSTQFHGSVGKSAASAAGPSLSSFRTSPDDDGLPRLSWRGDSAYFCLSSVDELPGFTHPRRVIRMFSRMAELSSTSEPTGGLEHSLSWQPSGSIIASTQKIVEEGKVKSHHVIFFERNGLRRYDFALRELSLEQGDAIVKDLSWNCDSTLLAVWIRRGSRDFVQLWHRNNYHWYLKQELKIRSSEMSSILWHPESGLKLYIVTLSGLESFSLCWDTLSSARPPPHDTGSVAVVDGSSLLLTPFRLANVPPPMAAVTLQSSRPGFVPAHVSFSSVSSSITTVHSEGFVEVWNWELPIPVRGKAREELVMPTLSWSSRILSENDEGYCRQCAGLGEGQDAIVAVLVSRRRGDVIFVAKAGAEPQEIPLEGRARRLIEAGKALLIQTDDGSIFEANPTSSEILTPRDDLSLPEFCPQIQHIAMSGGSGVIGLSKSGRLYIGQRTLATDATSFTTTPEFLIYTTFSHESKYIPVQNLDSSSHSPLVAHTEANRRPGEESSAVSSVRAVERGARIVTVIPSSTSLILQMPRGNLETVAPRPLVLNIVRQDLEKKRYRAAFLACRRHRIDLNILHDYDGKAFFANLSQFVAQVKEVDYLNLFLTGLKSEDVTKTMYRPLSVSSSQSEVPSTKINDICDAVRQELEGRDHLLYVNTILTSHVRKQPPDYESALRVLLRIKSQDKEAAEEAVKYIIFLSDANKLFDLALGMYDFSLVLMVAQNSQKDPREYLPFLRELRELETYVQRFKIDDHLERRESALRNLAKAGPDHFEEALTYTKQHKLFTTAMEAFKDDSSRYRAVLLANAEYLFSELRWSEAALLFSVASQPARAAEAYKKAHAWRELFDMLLVEKRPASEIKATALEVGENLRSRQRYEEAGHVLLEYGRDVDTAISAFVEGAYFAEAIRLTSLYNRRDLLDTHIKPGTLETQAKLSEEISDAQEQLEKQRERFAELRQKKISNPHVYFCWFGPPDGGLENVDLQPDGASDAGTAFTRYTSAPTTVVTTHVSGTTARSKRKGGLKRAAGKKGTVYEEMYLLRSLKKTAEEKLGELQEETSTLLPVLLKFNSASHRSAAFDLQADLKRFETELAKTVETVWTALELSWKQEVAVEKQQRESGTFVEKPPVEDDLKQVVRPRLASNKWKISLLDIA